MKNKALKIISFERGIKGVSIKNQPNVKGTVEFIPVVKLIFHDILVAYRRLF